MTITKTISLGGNPIRDRKENVFKEVLKGYGFKYDKKVCLITKDFSKGCMRVSFDYDRGVLIGWTITIWNKNYEKVYYNVFLKSENFDADAFDEAYKDAKAFMRKM